MTLAKLWSHLNIASRLVFVALAVLLPASLVAQNYTYVNIDYPGGQFSSPEAVNDHGQVVGSYQDSAGIHGFYYDGSTYTSLDFPGNSGGTLAEGINNSGVISGEYLTNQGTETHGFVYQNGVFTSYDYPDFVGQTDGQGINNNGELVGYYGFGPTYGFFDASGGFSSFQYPQANSTLPHALNDTNEVAGYYRIGCCTSPLGFFYQNGTFTTIEYPDDYQTYAAGINNAGMIVGYSNLNNPPYTVGWLWQNGVFTAINSDATPQPAGINNNGQLVGVYFPGGEYHGFLATPIASSQPYQFIPIVPCRVVDTRNPNGTFGGPPINGNTTRSFPLSEGDNPCGIPSTAAAYSLNVTVVPEHTLGYLTIWPTGQGQPVASTLNSPDGRIKANAAIVPAGTPSGSVSIYVTDTTNVILDIDGYFQPPASGSLQFYALPPCRVVDTRGPDGPLGGPSLAGGANRDFPVLQSACGLPQQGAQAYSFNITAVPHGASGYVTLCPTPSDPHQSCPQVSTLNWSKGQVTANAAIVPAGTGGSIRVNPSNDTDLLIDVNGYFGAPGGTGALSLYPVVPCRVLDTRPHPFQFELSPPVDVRNSPCAPPSKSQAYVFNATVVPQGGGLGYLTLWPDGGPQPQVSTLNAFDGAITSNMAIVPAGQQNGKIDAYASPLNQNDPNDVTNLILDISGYFAP